ncbi:MULTISPECIES: MDR efflux pump AcrAB transcriptional activator RobA [unclassified Gilliamella]|uniref:MDR efflux pump AcrAB transcriptional activator RobA n=1 Tax=unclassified Gilliamella TaxID=2685620 RepID=UPI00080DBDD3|nr:MULTISPECIES: MDR efflux pump AcrAB transcriptional activator RobA [Gilliamella]MCX8581649.1 MDR efflux pump AcrAB transcriptional activator RobA [Gilliamella sp. B3482]MCX8584431.1 MDR efflux pump AcrAB transcriptional activator RobA [Gilliamella sp. B3372]MCX8585660.1 MDR efflux pump AcrAB transcriptional activator RobA [Gilliamella sp. B3562]MCX8595266.1 MDR efflux pump AcrAB transcriptional activator RobA [Gilliamella sp. B3367]MCX8597952.1 MDR efflux pump AcrAB transcriptional activato
MNQVSIISDLIVWIEKNLEQPLSIDNVAQKSGYSKWHLQRMFKEVTGQVLGTYIRHRRLTYAALSLRMTSKPILDIAMQYRFDSQQTFTRSFKKQFNETPASYRRGEFWDPTGLTPAIELNKNRLSLPEPKFVNMPKQTFWGISYKNNCNLSQILDEENKLRSQFFHNYLSHYENKSECLPDKIFAFSRILKSKDNANEQELLYTIALDHNNNLEHIEPFVSEGGLYLCFKYIGPPENFSDFISQVHLAAMPALKVRLRSSSCLIEIHHNHHDDSVKCFEDILSMECDYCVPVVADEEVNIQSNLSL